MPYPRYSALAANELKPSCGLFSFAELTALVLTLDKILVTIQGLLTYQSCFVPESAGLVDPGCPAFLRGAGPQPETPSAERPVSACPKGPRCPTRASIPSEQLVFHASRLWGDGCSEQGSLCINPRLPLLSQRPPARVL